MEDHVQSVKPSLFDPPTPYQVQIKLEIDILLGFLMLQMKRIDEIQRIE